MPRVCRVVPDVTAIERLFDYTVPDHLAPDLRVGTIVRVPLHGRRVRGWVVGTDVESEVEPAELRPLLGIVSAGPPADVVDIARWTAARWAGPLVAVLRSASPPNIVRASSLPRATAPAEGRVAPDGSGGVRIRRVPPLHDRLGAVTELLASEGSSIVLIADAGRARALRAHLHRSGRTVSLLHSDTTDAERTQAWAAAAAGRVVVVGGRIGALAPVPDLRCAVVVDDLDEALQEERVPTWHARGVLAERARRVGCALTVVSPMPSTEAVVLAGPHGVDAPPAPVEVTGWPRVDVVDRTEEPPGGGLLTARLAEAIRDARAVPAPVVCVVNRRGRIRLQACRDCGRLVRRDRSGEIAVVEMTEAATPTGVCPHCGSLRLRSLRAGVTRLAEELAALVPDAVVHDLDATTADTDDIGPSDIVVGTEAVFHRRGLRRARPALVAFLDLDQELLAPRVRVHEQAAWLLVRASQLLAGRPRAQTRLLLQTRDPHHEVVAAIAAGQPARVTEGEIARRSIAGRPFPPFAAVAEVSGDVASVAAACDAVRTLEHESRGIVVIGPLVDRQEASRALLRAPDADALGAAAMEMSRAAREVGRVRIVVDPPRL